MTGAPQPPDRQRQLETAAVILGLARAMVDDGACLTADELRYLSSRLVESLTDVLRIAASQGDALPETGGGDLHNASTLWTTRP